jgi:uncharacterized protein with NRDE domain
VISKYYRLIHNSLYIALVNSSPLILVSNRDEVLDRPTSSARFWDPPYNHILGPYDLLRQEHGTWIGVNRQGKVCVLLNIHKKVNEIKKISRGLFTREYLESTDGVKEWIAKATKKYGDDLQQTGGFYMFLADLNDNGDPPMLFSNQDPPRTCTGPRLSLSNSETESDHWPKVDIGEQVFDEIISEAQQNNWSEDALIEGLFRGLSNDTFPRDEPANIELVRHSVFVPPFKFPNGDLYGTRTQTVYLVDRNGNARYVEKTLQDSLISEFKYKIGA